VTTSEGNFIRPISSPLTVPRTTPKATHIAIASHKPIPDEVILAKATDTSASIDATDKSICPQTITRVMPSASSPASTYRVEASSRYRKSRK
jgi:hypothetical protein